MMMNIANSMKIAGIIDDSLSNGKGIRTVIFTQGCEHECRGCHNTHTWNRDAGEDIAIDKIIKIIKHNRGIVSGVTISGGEPFLQPKELLSLVTEINKQLPELNVAVYTGYTKKYLEESSDINNEILNIIDVLIDGKFDANDTCSSLRYTGSANQKIYCKNGFMWEGGILWE